ncbi:MAG: hypothetical protein CBB87_00200 [Micavibrio sp. TMED27]|nr:response regulator [Micavibrio sp.]OUT93015.1 MAG: hypothetical protein CBB87_00200 [Micavibrio sp. TMED27]|tara:strand:+ start:12496 stop:12945 length:450 start_codon:yes stop_codon:yes gene_type:complete
MKQSAMSRPIEILLVEDNVGDVVLTREAFKESKLHNKLNVVQDGEEALDYLYKRSGFENVNTPDIILLDLNIPKMDGTEVLAKIKEDEDLKRIPTAILTSSKAEQDIVKSYDLHANSYVLKPVDMATFKEVAKAIENFWFAVVLLPPHE